MAYGAYMNGQSQPPGQHPVHCEEACCSWPPQWKAKIGSGLCPRCGMALDDHDRPMWHR